jgi:hypothetical protein
MVLSRRNLLTFGPALLIAGKSPIQGQQGKTGQGRGAYLTRANFEAVVNSSFEVHSASGQSSFLVLTSVENLTNAQDPSIANFAVPPRRAVSGPNTDAFALRFYAAGATLGQGTYGVKHETLGAFDLFIVPSGTSGYVAVFNRLMGPRPRM